MTKEELKKRVDNIKAISNNDEEAHRSEDSLRLEVIKEFCPKWVVAEINRLYAVDFHRWFA